MIFSSVLVQAADVYFHIAAEAVQLVQMSSDFSPNYQFSRGLAPWCLNKPAFGDSGEEKLWGCAITAQTASYNNATSLAPTNATTIQDMKNSISDQHSTIVVTDPSGVQFAIVGPPNIDTSLDWKASSYGVSTTCAAIPEGACAVADPIGNAKDGRSNPVMLVPFQCSKNETGIDITGNLTTHNTATHMMNFHKYTGESAPFFDANLRRLNIPIASNGSESANEIFRNNWNVFVMRKIPSAVQGDFSQLPPSFPKDSRIWKHDLLGAFMLLHCNVTGRQMDAANQRVMCR